MHGCLTLYDYSSLGRTVIDQFTGICTVSGRASYKQNYLFGDFNSTLWNMNAAIFELQSVDNLFCLSVPKIIVVSSEECV